MYEIHSAQERNKNYSQYEYYAIWVERVHVFIINFDSHGWITVRLDKQVATITVQFKVVSKMLIKNMMCYA